MSRPADRQRSGDVLRWLAIAAGAVILASCRSMSHSVVPVATLVEHAAADDDAAAPADGPPAAAAVTAAALPSDAPRTAAPAGVEPPSPPLPRVALASHAAPLPVAAAGAPCPDGRCHASVPAGPGGTEGCGSPHCRLHPGGRLGSHLRRHLGHGAGCRGGECQSGACGPIVPTVAIPVVGPCLVCDGGDHGKPALARGARGLVNLTSGDTVARYRADGPGPAPEDEACLEAEACVVASNCTCVYAPRFSSVRRVIRPFEDAVPVGPKGVALDTLVEAEVAGQGVRDKTQPVQVVAARRAQPGIAVEDRIPVLAVDKVQPPRLEEAFAGPKAHALDQPAEPLVNVEAPRLARRIEVPMAWSCVSGAQVTVNGEAADVLAVDHGVATLRIESPGRCELTLSKRAGSDTARPGEELDFTIFLLNSGDRPITDVTLADAVPARLEVIENSAVSNLPADVSTAKAEDGSTVITWAIRGTLAPGQGGFVRFRTIVH